MANPRDVSTPPGHTATTAVPDPEPAEYPWSSAVYADWITDELRGVMARV